MAETRIRVLLADDHPVVRMGLRAMIEAEPDLAVAGEAASGEEAVAQHASLRPDVVLMDLRMPGMGGAEAIAAIRRTDPEARVIVVTTYDADEDVYRAVEAGARGYLLKATFRTGLLEAIRAVHAGQRVIPPEVASRLAERLSGPSLTEREVQILRLVGKGLTNKEIGAALFLAEDTIKNRLKRIYVKLDVSDRAEALYTAVQRGLIRPDE